MGARLHAGSFWERRSLQRQLCNNESGTDELDPDSHPSFFIGGPESSTPAVIITNEEGRTRLHNSEQEKHAWQVKYRQAFLRVRDLERRIDAKDHDAESIRLVSESLKIQLEETTRLYSNAVESLKSTEGVIKRLEADLDRAIADVDRYIAELGAVRLQNAKILDEMAREKAQADEERAYARVLVVFCDHSSRLLELTCRRELRLAGWKGFVERLDEEYNEAVAKLEDDEADDEAYDAVSRKSMPIFSQLRDAFVKKFKVQPQVFDQMMDFRDLRNSEFHQRSSKPGDRRVLLDNLPTDLKAYEATLRILCDL